MSTVSKRIISLLLALALVLSTGSGMMPAAYAAETDAIDVVLEEATDVTAENTEETETVPEVTAAEASLPEETEEFFAETVEETVADETEEFLAETVEETVVDETEAAAEETLEYTAEESREAMLAETSGTLTLSVQDLGAEWKRVTTGTQGNIVWTATGNTISGVATGYVNTFGNNKFEVAIETTITLTNNKNTEALLKFDYKLTGGKVSATAGTMENGKFSYEIPAGASVDIKLTSPAGASSATLDISNIALMEEVEVTTVFEPTENGSYTVDGEAVTAAVSETRMSTTPYELKATPAQGYQFFGWWSEAKQGYLSYEDTASLMVDENDTIHPQFIDVDTAIFGVGAAKFLDLTGAADYAKENDASMVVLLYSGSISGNHTIPAGITLLIPHDELNTLYTETPGNVANTWTQPVAYRTLNLKEDASIAVNGAISVGGAHSAARLYNGSPSGNVGFVTMEKGSNITVNDGGALYAWGYVTGSGSVTAKNGAKIYENFQFSDFRGGSCTSVMATEFMVFPMTQYYVQNIEVATTYEYGSEEYVHTSLYMSNNTYSAGVRFIGDGAMFDPEEGAYITKTYEGSKDRLKLDVYGNAALNSLSLELGGTKVDSSGFVLPINSNITIHVHSGTTTLNQSVAMLPGSKLTLDDSAKLVLAEGAVEGQGLGLLYDGAHLVILYDEEEWKYGYDGNDETFQTIVEGKFVADNKRLIPLKYAPGMAYSRTEEDLVDAELDINGTIITDGFLYTTESGANVHSSNGTGKVIMRNGPGQNFFTVQANQVDTEPVYVAILMDSVSLKNADGTATETDSDNTDAVGYAYSKTSGTWVTGYALSFDGNGATSGSVADVTVPVATEKAVLPENSFVRTNATFVEWNTKKDGSGTGYQPGDEIAVTGDTTLYAQWNIPKYTVTFTVDGEEYEKVQFEVGAAVTAPDFDVPEGHNFSGWTLPEVMPGEDITLNATLEKKNYTITYHVGEGDGISVDGSWLEDENGKYITSLSSMAKYGDVITVRQQQTEENCFDSSAGLLFRNWNTKEDGSGTAYEPGDEITVSGNVDLYAQWGMIAVGPVLLNSGEYVDLKGNITTTQPSGGYAGFVYDEETDAATLTLNNYSHSGKLFDEAYAVHYNCENLTIAMSGASSLSSEVSVCDVVITGEGSLTISSEPFYGISAFDMTVESGTLTIDASGEAIACEKLTVNGGMLVVKAGGLCAADLDDEGAFLTEGVVTLGEGIVIKTPAGGKVVCDTEEECWYIGDAEGNEATAFVIGAPSTFNVTFKGTHVISDGAATAAEGSAYTAVLTPEEGYNLPESVTVEVDGKAVTDFTYADGKVTIPAKFITGDIRIGAVSTIKTYTITLLQDDGTEIGKCTVEHGKNFSYAVPTKAATAEYTYTFAGWSPAVVPAVENATYTATYDAEPNVYTVTFTVNDKAYKKLDFAYGTAVTAPDYTAPDGYEFSGWTLPATMPAQNITLNAVEAAELYDVTLVGSEYVTMEGDSGAAFGQEYSVKLTPKVGSEVVVDSVTVGGKTVTDLTWANGVLTIPVENVTGDIVITVHVDVNVTFNGNGGVCTDELYYDNAEIPRTEPYGTEVELNLTFARTGYTFIGFNTAADGTGTPYGVSDMFVPIETTVLYAQWKANEHKLIWNLDGKDQDPVTVAYDTVLKAPEAITERIGYTFIGWDGEIPATMPDQDITVSLTSKWEANKYTIKFVNEDDTELQSGEVAYDQMPVYTGKTPTKAADVQYTYTFKGWDKEITKVTGDTTYTAVYDKTTNKYTVKFVDEDNKLLSEAEVEYGTVPTAPANPTKEATAEFTYTFAGWDKDIVAVTGDVTYKAVYTSTVNKYTITFVNQDGEELQKSSVEYGATPVYSGSIPTKAADVQFTYTFKGWDKEIKPVTGDEIYTANYSTTVNKYTITFVNEDGTELQKSDVEYGAMPKYTGNKPAKAADAQYTYAFKGWHQEIESVTGAATYQATYTATVNKYTVRFVNDDGKLLTETKVEYGTVPTAPAAPTKAATAQFSYTFKNWDKTITAVTGNVTYKAVYEAVTREYTITWNIDGKETTTSVEYGEVPVAPIATKEADEQYTYTFKNWTPAIKAVTGEATYTAVFTKTGWVTDSKGTTYVVEDQIAYMNALAILDGEAWFFNAKGYIVAGQGLVRHVKADGEVNYYYFCEDSFNAFKGGSLWVSKTNGLKLPANEYTFDADGVILHNADTSLNGMVDEGEDTVYYVDGIPAYMGLILENGDYYYVRSSAKLVKGQNYWISKTNGLLPEKAYKFDEEGRLSAQSLSKHGIVEENGSLYYYAAGDLNYAGLIEIDGDYYYVRSNGQLVQNQNYWITKTNGLLPEKAYTFGADGKMFRASGIIDGYYYVDGVKTYAGLIEIDGSYYYVNSSCKVIAGCKYWITKTNGLKPEKSYTFGKDGRMVEETQLGFTGEKDGYIYRDGEKVYEGLFKGEQYGLEEGQYYYANSSGKLICARKYWVTKTNGLLPEGSYRFDTDGKLIP